MRTHRFARFTALLLLLALLPAGCVRSRPATAEKLLPVDPKVKMGTLPNDLNFWLRSHQTPPGKVGIWLHVSSGSINEENDQRGLAHFLEHMAFNGSANFPPGTLVKFFESLGLRFGQHQNAFTSFNQTTYTLALPDTKAETLDQGFLCLADYAFRLSLLPKEIDKERGVILEEMRARAGSRRRLFKKILPLMFPGSRVAERMTIGKEEVIKNAPPERVRSYYRKWYHPGNATLLVVGDVDAKTLAQLVRRHFSKWPVASPRPVAADPGIKPYTKTRAAVLSDPELTTAEVSAVAVRPLRQMRTEKDFREDVVDDIGTWILNRRLRELVQKGTAPFQKGRLRVGPFLNVCTYISASAEGRPDKWSAMLRSLLTEVKRGREHGFLAQELADARKVMLANAGQAARTESTSAARSLLRRLNRAVAQERKPMSAAQRLELLRKLLPEVTLAEAVATFRRNFDPGARLLVVTLPEKAGLTAPSMEKVLALARQAEAAAVTPLVAKARPKTLLENEPRPGAVVRQEEDPDLKILSVTLGNGVRAHLRRMDFKKDQVFVRLTLAGGRIRETARTRGITDIAVLALSQPASRKLSATEIRDLMTGKNVSLKARVGPDSVTLRITGSPQDIEAGLRLAHLLLTAPRLEAAALKVWKQSMIQALNQRQTSVGAQMREKLNRLLSNDDPRFRVLTPEQVERLTLAAGQKWLDELVRTAPLEVAIVGDLERSRALELVRKYFGSLPRRPLTAAALEPLRRLQVPTDTRTAIVEVDTVTKRAVVVLGWRGTDWRNVKERRLLSLAAQILQGRLREEIRENRGLTYSVGCGASAAREYPGTGMLRAVFTADPLKVEEASRIARDLMERFAAAGPTEEDMQTVRKQFRNIIQQLQKEPNYWAGILADLDYHGTRLSDVKEVLEQYLAYTRADVLAVLGKYVRDKRFIQVIALPRKTTGAGGKPGGGKERP